MSTDRDQNGPTQVHPALNNVYSDLTSHMQLNGLNGLSNGLNGLNSMSKPFAERGETGLEALLPRKSRTKIFQESREIFSLQALRKRGFSAEFSLPSRLRCFVERVELHCHALNCLQVDEFDLLGDGRDDAARAGEHSRIVDRHCFTFNSQKC